MAVLRTEFDFTLPKGFIAPDGHLHRDGTMRLATARDEIEPLRDRTIDGPDDPYLTVLVLQRVITRLGSLSLVDVDVVEGLFAADLAFLQDLYGIINFGNPADVEALQNSVLSDEPDVVESVDDAPADDATNVAESDDSADEPPYESPPPRRRGASIEEVVSTSRQ